MLSIFSPSYFPHSPCSTHPLLYCKISRLTLLTFWFFCFAGALDSPMTYLLGIQSSPKPGNLLQTGVGSHFLRGVGWNEVRSLT